MNSMAEHWNREAQLDPRYKAGVWGMGLEGREDPHGTVDKILAELSRDLPVDFAGNVAEIGCGPGRLLFPFADQEHQATFTGIDVSPEMLRLATKEAEWHRRPRVHLCDMSTTKGWPIGKCDIVYAVEVLQHLDDEALALALKQADHLLKSGGTFVGQFVNNSRPAEPFSYPRNYTEMDTFFGAEWAEVGMRRADELHPEWCWVRAVRV